MEELLTLPTKRQDKKSKQDKTPTGHVEVKYTRTEELAVMFDTQYPLELTAEALAMDDPAYPLSWLG